MRGRQGERPRGKKQRKCVEEVWGERNTCERDKECEKRQGEMVEERGGAKRDGDRHGVRDRAKEERDRDRYLNNMTMGGD